MTVTRSFTSLAIFSALTLSGTSATAAPADETPTENTAEEGRRFSSRGEPRDRDKWIYRWAPVRNMGELGIYGGVWFPSKHLELFDPVAGLVNNGWQRLNLVSPEIGLRAGYYPLRFLGVELEGGVMPTKTRSTDAGVTAWTFRGHVVAQLGLWSITPFLLAGTGVLGVNSAGAPEALGADQDVAIHFGGGAKFYLNRWVQLRLDVRDVVSNRRGVGEGLTSSPEILLGLTMTLGRSKKKKPKPGPGDRDGDRVLDNVDFCPDTFGVEPRGCPTVCLDDNDGDGLANPEDQCPDDPETRNGFEDRDGCPDEVPPELADLAGIMTGITFDNDQDTIRSGSTQQLDHAVEIMQKYPTLRLRVVGHTDSRGGYHHNLDLSRRRANSVKEYMTSKGIDTDRIETSGVGPDQPLETNDTAEGRAKNRRIEFIILEEETSAEPKTQKQTDRKKKAKKSPKANSAATPKKETSTSDSTPSP